MRMKFLYYIWKVKVWFLEKHALIIGIYYNEK